MHYGLSVYISGHLIVLSKNDANIYTSTGSYIAPAITQSGLPGINDELFEELLLCYMYMWEAMLFLKNYYYVICICGKLCSSYVMCLI